MIHELLRRRLSEYLDESLSEKDQARLDRHLADCKACRSELAELRQTVALLREIPAFDPPPELAARVLAEIDARAANPSLADRLRSELGRLLRADWVPAFASVAVLLVVAALLRVEIQVHLPFDFGKERAPSQAEPQQVLFTGSSSALSVPLAPRRRFDALERASSVEFARASGLRRACLARPHDPACQAFHQSMMLLALEDTPAFVDEFDSVPPPARERWLGALSSIAARSGSAARVASRLRESDDPRAIGIAVRFERPVASRD